VFGHDVQDDYQQARDAIGLAPQEFNVDRFFPIREVLQHKAGYHGIPESEAADRADDVLRRVGIYDKRDTRFDWLSGGMKRRFVLARALVTEPDLLILDEPTAGVDVQLRHDLWELVADLNDAGTTILLTTHYIEEAERLCDEVAILDEGSLVTVASPEELMDRGTDRIRVGLRSPPSTVPDIGLPASVVVDNDGDGGSDDPGTGSRSGRPVRPGTTQSTAGGTAAGANGPFDPGQIESVELSEDGLVVTASQGGLVAPDLVRALDRAGHEIVDLEISRTSLEEVFVDITRRDEGDGDDTDHPEDEPEREQDRDGVDATVSTDGGTVEADDPDEGGRRGAERGDDE
jgi:ABC-2 type transport system ATP-binding protein